MEFISFAFMQEPHSTVPSIEAFLADYLSPGVDPATALPIISNTYHHFEASIYDAAHPEIWRSRNSLLQAIQTLFQNIPNSASILDLGCGTGFVTGLLLEAAVPGKIKRIVLYDLSSDMVEKARQKFQQPLDIQLEFISGKAEADKLVPGSFDLVITNAVLHHIADLRNFCDWVSQLVKPGGYFIAGHEPNAAFYTNSHLQNINTNFRRFKRSQSRKSMRYWLFKLGLVKAPSSTPYLDIIGNTNEKLLAEKIISKPIPAIYLPKLIDIHVPVTDFKNQPWGEAGFSGDDFAERFTPGFTMLETKSYSHIKDNMVEKFSSWKSMSEALAVQFPKDGADLLMVLRKKD